jgi:hypothetical protein
MAAACEICVVIIADGSVLNEWNAHKAVADLRLHLFSNVLSVDGETFASYYRERPITRCIVEALTPELMKHKMDNGEYANRIFNVSSEKLAVFLVVEISETVPVDDATGEFEAELCCVVDAGIEVNAKNTHDIAAVIDSLIMDNKPMKIANKCGDIVQVAPHVITFVIRDVAASVLKADRIRFLEDLVAGIIKTARKIGSDNKQG